VSAISGFCEKCNKFRKRHCDGNRNTCMSILFDTIEVLQAENEQLQAQLESLRCTSCGEIPATIGTDDGQYCEKCAEELDAVEVIDLLSYHNPADVEALRKAREKNEPL
jgi:hypothetical protein